MRSGPASPIGVLSNQNPVAGGSGFGVGLGIASPQAYPIRRVIRIGGIGGVAIPLDIPLSVALDHADIADLRGALVSHVSLGGLLGQDIFDPIGCRRGTEQAEILTRDFSRADDLVQNCLTRAVAKQHLWQYGTDLRAWLFTILHHQHVNDVRRSIREGSHVMLEEVPELTAKPNAIAVLELRDLEALSEGCS
jgi:Sigma2 domain of PhyR